MERETEKRDYNLLSMSELLDKLCELTYDLDQELCTGDLIGELDALIRGARVDVPDMADELTEHINVFTELKAVCEEMLRRVNGGDSASSGDSEILG